MISRSIYNPEGPDSGLWPVVDGVVSSNFSACQPRYVDYIRNPLLWIP